jgi:hypothetical protein
MATERISNLGYLAMKKEVTKGVAVTPNTYAPLYEEDISTDTHLDEDTAIAGSKYGRFQVLRGLRSHTGSLKVLAEPNTAARFFDMILAKGSPSGGGPYTHPFTHSNTVSPASYTVDVAKGQVVFRLIGVEISEIEPDFDENKMVFNLEVSALKSFTVREISSITGSGPYTINLKTNYDPSPTTGLVVADTMRVFKADGTTIDIAVASIPDGTSFTTVTNVSSAAAGDTVSLRLATPSYTLVSPFLWTRTEFRFSDTAANALTATHTPVEKGSKWKIRHEFEDKEGAKRSGSFDPAALVRKRIFADFNIKKFFDTPDDYNKFVTAQAKACVIRSFSETGYELRITLNEIRPMTDPVPLKDDEVIYEEIEYAPVMCLADSQAFDVKVINALATI